MADASQLERVEFYKLMFSCCKYGEEKPLLDIVASALLPCSRPPHHSGMFLHASSITVHSLGAGCGVLELVILILISSGMKRIGLWETESLIIFSASDSPS